MRHFMNAVQALSEDEADPYGEIAQHALPQYRFTYGQPQHIDALRQRHRELEAKWRRERDNMPSDESRELWDLGQRLAAYDKVKPLHRLGSDHEFSEFTFDPKGDGHPRRMHGGRDTGFASGMYAFQTPRDGTVEVTPPRHPLVIEDLPEHERRDSSVPGTFQVYAISLMRMAEQYAGFEPEPLADWEVKHYSEFPTAEVDVERGLRLKPDASQLKGYAGMPFKKVVDFFRFYAPEYRGWRTRDDVMHAIAAWEKHRQVHPLNILLSNWGFDGVVWGDNDKAREGDSGAYGAVKFPPIDKDGRVIGLHAADGKYMRLRS